MKGKEPFQKNIHLTLELYCPKEKLQSVGDLDNFITGVCDGLMATNPRAFVSEDWSRKDLENIAPEKTIAIKDDNAAIEIVAKKLESETEKTWYRIFLEGE